MVPIVEPTRAAAAVQQPRAGEVPSSRLVVPRALVLLSGSVRPTGLGASAGRSLLDLPVETGRTVMDLWRQRAIDFAKAAGIGRLGVELLADPSAPQPKTPEPHERLFFEIHRDAGELRGSAGALADHAQRFADDDWVLVANAAQVLLEPLDHLVGALVETGGDVAMISHRDGTPGGLTLVRCGCLRVIPKIGFSDMKEQALPLIARRFAVKVLHRAAPSGLPIRTASDYIDALRRYHRAALLHETRQDPFAEDWRPTFSIVEPGAQVHPTAQVHDSVVLAGAKVGAGAILVRSVVCPGAAVAGNRQELDRLVAPARRR